MKKKYMYIFANYNDLLFLFPTILLMNIQLCIYMHLPLP